MRRSKRYRAIKEMLSGDEPKPLREAIGLVRKLSSAKFDESVEMSVRLGVDPKKSDQMVRGTVSLPHGTGKELRVLVLAAGEKEKEASEAGADWVGSDEYIEKIQGGWLDFDKVVATPEVMGKVGKLGKILGPRGLMPNPKSGTVTFEVGKAVTDLKKGKVEFRVDKSGVIHGLIGKCSFKEEQLFQNAAEFLREIVRAKPSTSKGTYLRSIFLSSTMGPSVMVDPRDCLTLVK